MILNFLFISLIFKAINYNLELINVNYNLLPIEFLIIL